MKKVVLLLVLAVMIVGSVPVLADGMFYWPESVPPEIPYQRALLMFDGGYETLIVQSKYRMSSSATEAFGWVVPVPSVPELASVEPVLAEYLFFALSLNSQPNVTDVSDWLWELVGIICVFIAPTAAFCCSCSVWRRSLLRACRSSGAGESSSLRCLFSSYSYPPSRYRSSGCGHSTPCPRCASLEDMPWT